MRQRNATRVVAIVAVVLVTVCVGWALLAQAIVPDACDPGHLQDRAGPVQCEGHQPHER